PGRHQDRRLDRRPGPGRRRRRRSHYCHRHPGNHRRVQKVAHRALSCATPETRFMMTRMNEESAATVLIRAPIEVRWRDLDAFNHVNNATYLTYLEQARLAWLKNVPGTWFDEHAMPVMAASHLNYRRPIGWPADVVVA